VPRLPRVRDWFSKTRRESRFRCLIHLSNVGGGNVDRSYSPPSDEKLIEKLSCIHIWFCLYNRNEKAWLCINQG
jgi:hypothetical protein